MKILLTTYNTQFTGLFLPDRGQGDLQIFKETFSKNVRIFQV